MNYKSLLDLILYRLFTAEYTNTNNTILEIGNKLYNLLTNEETDKLCKFYMNAVDDNYIKDNNLEVDINRNLEYPDITITENIINNFPTIQELKEILFN